VGVRLGGDRGKTKPAYGEGAARALGVPMSEVPTNGKDLDLVREVYQPTVGCLRVKGLSS
jgi:hypothetical protein